jgi:hypothetical protein
MTEKMGFEKNRTVTFEWHNKCHLYRQPDGMGIKLKSTQELKWAKYLDLLLKSHEILGWQYEPRTFEFNERYCKRGQYTPDFFVTKWNSGGKSWVYMWFEIKTSLRQKEIYRFKQFRADYPDEPITLVMTSEPKKRIKQIELLGNARKYVNDVIFAGPIFRKLGF